MNSLVRGVMVISIIVVLLCGAVGSVRWAKRGGTAARVMAGALVLGLGFGVVVTPPQQGVEQAEEGAEKAKSESDEPLA